MASTNMHAKGRKYTSWTSQALLDEVMDYKNPSSALMSELKNRIQANELKIIGTVSISNTSGVALYAATEYGVIAGLWSMDSCLKLSFCKFVDTSSGDEYFMFNKCKWHLSDFLKSR